MKNLLKKLKKRAKSTNNQIELTLLNGLIVYYEHQNRYESGVIMCAENNNPCELCKYAFENKNSPCDFCIKNLKGNEYYG